MNPESYYSLLIGVSLTVAALKDILGHSKEKIWKQIADDIGGDYISGGFWGNDQLVYSHQHWIIVLDTYTVHANNIPTHYTRMRAPYINRDGLYFTIYREGLFSFISKMLGMQDIIINDDYFDDHFVIKGNDESKITLLLSCPKLKSLIDKQPNLYFQVKSDSDWEGLQFPEEVDQLYFQCVGIVTDKKVLSDLFELFTWTLNRLIHIDSAYENDPSVYLLHEKK